MLYCFCGSRLRSCINQLMFCMHVQVVEAHEQPNMGCAADPAPRAASWGNAVGVSPQWLRGQQCPRACTFCCFSSLATQSKSPMTVHQPTSSSTCPMAVHQPPNSHTCSMSVHQPTSSQTCPMIVHQPINSQTCPLKSGEYLSCCASLHVSASFGLQHLAAFFHSLRPATS